MGINLVIAVTDGNWFEMLRWQPDLGEVNFWEPSAANFRALQPGELFLFKLHAPRNVIGSGGIFAYANALSCDLPRRSACLLEYFGSSGTASIVDGEIALKPDHQRRAVQRSCPPVRVDPVERIGEPVHAMREGMFVAQDPAGVPRSPQEPLGAPPSRPEATFASPVMPLPMTS